MGVCNCSMFCCTLLYVHSSIAIILMGKRELFALLDLSSWCLVMRGWTGGRGYGDRGCGIGGRGCVIGGRGGGKRE